MDVMQEQVTTLIDKVDSLHHAMGLLNDRMSELLSTVRPDDLFGGANQQFGISPPKRSLQTHRGFDQMIDHKDVLMDNMYPEHDKNSVEKTLSPEIQIQRLTAQLTAAYNRIAALEEQLLSTRTY